MEDIFGTESLTPQQGHHKLVEATMSSNAKLIERVKANNRNVNQMLEEEKVSPGMDELDRHEQLITGMGLSFEHSSVQHVENERRIRRNES